MESVLSVCTRIVGRVLPLLVVGCLVAFPAHAQFATQARSYDIGTGFMQYRNGGLRHESLSMVIATQFAWRIRANNHSALLVGINGTGFVSWSTADDCVVPTDYDPTSTPLRCAPDAPSGVQLSPVVGVEQRIASMLALRLSAGPSVVFGNERPSALGFQTRFDLVSPAAERAGFIVWVQKGFTPSRYQTTARLLTFGVGVRAR